MMKKSVRCPHCSGEMEISIDPAQLNPRRDITVRCPRCKQDAEFTISQKNAAAQKTNCYFCGEEILPSAIKCKHCGEWVGSAGKKDSSAARAVSRGIKQRNFTKIALKSKLLLLLGAFILIGTVIDRMFLKYFHKPITSPEFKWLIPCIVIPLLVICLVIAVKFLGQYYEE